MGYDIHRALLVARDFVNECLRPVGHNRCISFAEVEVLFREWKETTRATMQMPRIGPVLLRRLVLTVCADAAIWGNHFVGLERRRGSKLCVAK
jgi:hypothetical protein